jgi:peptidyl-prolyl cis-trans isomerase-like 4
MSVVLETSLGDITIDLHVKDAPTAAKNFLKLCKLKYYNDVSFHKVERNFMAQSGDPTGTGRGGESAAQLLYGAQARYFDDEISATLKHDRRGVVSMANAGPNQNASQFFITLQAPGGAPQHYLDGKHSVFGVVAEGMDVLDALNDTLVDDAHRPLQAVRIRHTVVLADPFADPPQLAALVPPQSPASNVRRLDADHIGESDDEDADDGDADERLKAKEARSKAVVLEMIGDLPDADARPPDNILFVCQLNAVTTDDDLELIFSRFGTITECAIVKDWKTKASLQYAFIAFETPEQCEQAYFKMNNVLIDDRRIKVDFSQSVSKLYFANKRGDTNLGGQFDAQGRVVGSGGRDGDGGGGGGSGGGGGKAREICRNFQRGRCTFGDKCRHEHVEAAPAPPPQQRRRARSRERRRSRSPASKKHIDKRRSRSPVRAERRRSRSPARGDKRRNRSRSPVRADKHRSRSRSPERRRDADKRHRSRSPRRRRSRSRSNGRGSKRPRRSRSRSGSRDRERKRKKEKEKKRRHRSRSR